MKKVISIILIMVMLIALIATNTYAAAQTFAINLSADNKEPHQADEITLTLRVKDFENMTDGIMGYTAKIEYDTAFFETLTQESFTAKGTWAIPTFNPETNLLTADSSTGIKVDSDVFTVKLKVKANALIGASSTVKIKDFKAAEGNSEIKAKEEATIDITIKAKEGEQQPDVPDTNTLTPDTNNAINITDTTTNSTNNTGNLIIGGNNTTNNTNINTNVNNTNTAGNIPQTGEEDWIFIALLAVILVGAVSYIKYRSIK